MLVYVDQPADHITLELALSPDGKVHPVEAEPPKPKAKPKEVPLHVRVSRLTDQLYNRHSAGCCLHIVTDDFNIQDSHVEFCMKYAEEQGHRQCFELAQLYRALSPKERALVLGLSWCPTCQDGREAWEKDCCGQCHQCGSKLEEPRQEIQ